MLAKTLKNGSHGYTIYKVVQYEPVDDYELDAAFFSKKDDAYRFAHEQHQAGVDVDVEIKYVYDRPAWNEENNG